MPNRATATGAQDSGEIIRRQWNGGRVACSKGGSSPQVSPSGTPTSTAMPARLSRDDIEDPFPSLLQARSSPVRLRTALTVTRTGRRKRSGRRRDRPGSLADAGGKAAEQLAAADRVEDHDRQRGEHDRGEDGRHVHAVLTLEGPQGERQ